MFQKATPEKSNEEITERMEREIQERNISDTIIIPVESRKEESMPIESTLSKARSPHPDIASFAEKTFSHNIAPTMKAMAEFRQVCQDSALTKIELFSYTPALTKLYYEAFNDTRSEILEAFPDVNTKKIDDAIILCKSFQNYMNEWKQTLEVVNKRGVSKVVSDSVNHLD